MSIDSEMQPHPAAEIFPVMSALDFDTLVADIKQNGQLEPIVVYSDTILDGRHRYRACQQLSIEPIFHCLSLYLRNALRLSAKVLGYLGD